MLSEAENKFRDDHEFCCNNTGGSEISSDPSTIMFNSDFAASSSTNPSNASISEQPPSPVLSDSAFTATPIIPHTPTPIRMQNHAANQRSPSVVQEQVSVLSRKLSVKSNESHSSHDAPPGILTTIHQGEEAGIGRESGDLTLGIEVAMNNCSLTKSGSAKSTMSVRSYRSLRGIGPYQVGTLRVHSPSPTRSPTEEVYPCMKDGDIFVVRDIPAGVVFGYDTRTLSIKEPGQFEGIKNMPAGAHLIWASSDVTSLRTGYWIMTSKKTSDEYGEIFVRRWDEYNEILDEVGSIAEERNQKQSLPEFVDRLQAYELPVPASVRTGTTTDTDRQVWQSLTSCMKGAFLSRITGKTWNHWQISSTHDYKRDRDPNFDTHSSLDEKKDEVLMFVFPKDTRTFSADSYGRERTEQAIDTSAHITAVMSNCTYEDSDEIIGELQFCFLTGMILGNSACQEHWAHIVGTVFRAFRLAVEQPSFFEKFIRAFHAELMYDEIGFEGSSILDVESNLRDDMKVILTVFKSRLTEKLLSHGNALTNEQKAVGTAFEALESWLWRWGWDLRGNYVRKGNVQLEDGTVIDDLELTELEAEDERGEWAPQIVAVDDEGREIGLIRF